MKRRKLRVDGAKYRDLQWEQRAQEIELQRLREGKQPYKPRTERLDDEATRILERAAKR